MMQALAAETAAGGGHHEAFYMGAEFWVAVAFVILLVLFGKKVFRIIATGLDDRAETIRNQIEEATRLREEAQEMLAAYQRKQRDAVKDAEEIVQHAREEARRIAERAEAELETSLKRREQLALDRINQAEAKALAEVQTTAVDVALDATRRLLEEKVTGAKAESLIDDAIKDLPNKLH